MMTPSESTNSASMPAWPLPVNTGWVMLVMLSWAVASMLLWVSESAVSDKLLMTGKGVIRTGTSTTLVTVDVLSATSV